MTSIAGWGTPQGPRSRGGQRQMPTPQFAGATPDSNGLINATPGMGTVTMANGAQPTGWNPTVMAGSPWAAMASGAGSETNANPQGTALNQTTAAPTPWGAPGATLQAFGPGNDMRGQSILPGASVATQTMQAQRDGATNAYSGFAFSPFQGMQPLDFGAERGLMTQANQNMQGLGFDFGAANNAFGSALASQQGAQGQAQSMLMGLAGSGGFGGGSAQADTTRFNQELDAALQGLQGPDRARIAADTMQLLEERSRGEFNRAQRETGQRAAALGRLGSGMTTNDLTDIVSQRERMLDRSRRDLAIDAAAQTLNDRLAVSDRQAGIASTRFGAEQFNAGLADAGMARSQQGAMFGANLQRGIAGDLYGMGRDGADLQMAIGDRFGQQARDRTGLGERQAGFMADTGRNLSALTDRSWQAAQSERDAARRDEFDRFDATGRRANDFNQFLQGERDNDFRDRQELRGERGFQDDMAERARQNAIQQQLFNEMLRSGAWTRAQGAGNLGFGDSPLNALFGAAGGARSNAFG